MNKKKFKKATKIYQEQIESDFKKGLITDTEYSKVITYFKAFIDFINWVEEQ